MTQDEEMVGKEQFSIRPTEQISPVAHPSAWSEPRISNPETLQARERGVEVRTFFEDADELNRSISGLQSVCNLIVEITNNRIPPEKLPFSREELLYFSHHLSHIVNLLFASTVRLNNFGNRLVSTLPEADNSSIIEEIQKRSRELNSAFFEILKMDLNQLGTFTRQVISKLFRTPSETIEFSEAQPSSKRKKKENQASSSKIGIREILMGGAVAAVAIGTFAFDSNPVFANHDEGGDQPKGQLVNSAFDPRLYAAENQAAQVFLQTLVKKMSTFVQENPLENYSSLEDNLQPTPIPTEVVLLPTEISSIATLTPNLETGEQAEKIPTQVITTVNANLRSSPTTESTKLTTIPSNTTLEVISVEKNGGSIAMNNSTRWLQVRINNQTGWIHDSTAQVLTEREAEPTIENQQLENLTQIFKVMQVAQFTPDLRIVPSNISLDQLYQQGFLVDPNLSAQVLLHLGENGLTYTENGTQLRLLVQVDEQNRPISPSVENYLSIYPIAQNDQISSQSNFFFVATMKNNETLVTGGGLVDFPDLYVNTIQPGLLNNGLSEQFLQNKSINYLIDQDHHSMIVFAADNSSTSVIAMVSLDNLMRQGNYGPGVVVLSPNPEITQITNVTTNEQGEIAMVATPQGNYNVENGVLKKIALRSSADWSRVNELDGGIMSEAPGRTWGEKLANSDKVMPKEECARMLNETHAADLNHTQIINAYGISLAEQREIIPLAAANWEGAPRVTADLCMPLEPGSNLAPSPELLYNNLEGTNDLIFTRLIAFNSGIVRLSSGRSFFVARILGDSRQYLRVWDLASYNNNRNRAASITTVADAREDLETQGGHNLANEYSTDQIMSLLSNLPLKTQMTTAIMRTDTPNVYTEDERKRYAQTQTAVMNAIINDRPLPPLTTDNVISSSIVSAQRLSSARIHIPESALQ